MDNTTRRDIDKYHLTENRADKLRDRLLDGDKKSILGDVFTLDDLERLNIYVEGN